MLCRVCIDRRTFRLLQGGIFLLCTWLRGLRLSLRWRLKPGFFLIGADLRFPGVEGVCPRIHGCQPCAHDPTYQSVIEPLGKLFLAVFLFYALVAVYSPQQRVDRIGQDFLDSLVEAAGKQTQCSLSIPRFCQLGNSSLNKIIRRALAVHPGNTVKQFFHQDFHCAHSRAVTDLLLCRGSGLPCLLCTAS